MLDYISPGKGAGRGHGQAIGDSVDLPPVNIVPPAPPTPEHTISTRIDDLATLWGYNLSLALGRLRFGATFTLTLYYRADGRGGVDYTRFVHLFGADGRLGAQGSFRAESWPVRAG